MDTDLTPTNNGNSPRDGYFMGAARVAALFDPPKTESWVRKRLGRYATYEYPTGELGWSWPDLEQGLKRPSAAGEPPLKPPSQKKAAGFTPVEPAELAHLDNMFAIKDLDVGEHYIRRGAYDSAIIYLKDVIKLHPTAPATRTAYLKLLVAYRAIKYTADAADLCTAALKVYPNDREVHKQCDSASSAAASTHRT